MNLSPHYKSLEDYVGSLEKKFIDRYLPANPADTPADYREDVSAFCVLLHAALEEYFEDVAKFSITDAVNNWKKSKKGSDVLIAICINLSNKMQIPSDGNYPRPIIQMLEEKIQEAKSQFLKEIEENHGVSKKYLARILGRLGIEIGADARFENSLAKIVEFRGELAHKKPAKILAPEDAKKYCEDCMLYCLEISTKATEALREN